MAIAAPLADLYDYLPPADCAAQSIAPGTRVLVPFGRGQRVGLVVERAEGSLWEEARLKAVTAALDAVPLLAPEDLVLIRWAADYYRHPLGEALLGALPARLRRAEPLRDHLVPGWRATSAGLALDLDALGRAERQRLVLGQVRQDPDGTPSICLGVGANVLQALRERGLIEACQVPPPSSAELPTQVPGADPDLNSDQARAVEQVTAALGNFRPFLLDGVTGSGKTEVYIRLIRAAIVAGGQTLLLVPEIGLTPQTMERLVRRLPGPLAVIHSALGEAERERAWHSAATGRATLVLGTRSACFVPLPRLALIVVDEEHDASLKQQEGFRYSARDLAVRRAQLARCPVVLGSATPSLETLHNARTGRYRRLHLPERAGGAQPPTISLLDIRGQPLSAGLSPLLRAHVDAELCNGNQVLLFLNRRGYSPILTCHDCGWVGTCPHCDARLTLHLKLDRLWCHHCGWLRSTPRACPDCDGLDLRGLGLGTERLEEELAAVFPEVSIARIDRDSTRRKGELERLIAGVRRGETRLLLGTQMLAKGHDFPGVTLVGILDLDQSLYAADFRAPERTAQLIVQVAGRAGRAERPGRVVLQTRHPGHPLLSSLLRRGYPGFADLALAERESTGLPPFGYLALLRADAPEQGVSLEFLLQARTLVLGLLADPALAFGQGRVQVRGPVPAPMPRRAGRHRSQLLLEAPARAGLQRLLARWVPELRAVPRRGGLRWSLDVDPQEMG